MHQNQEGENSQVSKMKEIIEGDARFTVCDIA